VRVLLPGLKPGVEENRLKIQAPDLKKISKKMKIRSKEVKPSRTRSVLKPRA
jgi:hypothetical protein